MRVLVTGGAGVIGSNFVQPFIHTRPGTEVINFDANWDASPKSTLSKACAARSIGTKPTPRASKTLVGEYLNYYDAIMQTVREPSTTNGSNHSFPRAVLDSSSRPPAPLRCAFE